MNIPAMTPPVLVFLFMLAAAPYAWGAAMTDDMIAAPFVVEQYQDCVDEWDRKVPKGGSPIDRAHPTGLISATLDGFRGSGPERKRMGRFTNCFLGAIEKRRAENERERELIRSQTLEAVPGAPLRLASVDGQVSVRGARGVPAARLSGSRQRCGRRGGRPPVRQRGAER